VLQFPWAKAEALPTGKDRPVVSVGRGFALPTLLSQA